MLERTSGCLEKGTVRCLLPTSQKALRSRRLLHSGFWVHTGSALDINHTFFDYSSNSHHIENQSRKLEDDLHSSAGSFLDFLYPSGVASLLHGRSAPGINSTTRTLRSKCGVARESRQYTAHGGAAQTQQGDGGSGDFGSIALNETAAQIHTEWSRQEAKRVANSSLTTNDHDEAHRQLHRQDLESKTDDIPDLKSCLSRSDRLVDADRMLDISSHPQVPDTAQTCLAVLRSSLLLGQISSAIQMQRRLVIDFEDCAGSDVIMAHLVSTSDWQSLVEVWANFQLFAQSHPSSRNFIWKQITAQSGMTVKAMELADYISPNDPQSKNEPVKPVTQLSAFAAAFISRTLLSCAQGGDISCNTLSILLQALKNLKADTPPVLEEIVQRLIHGQHTQKAIHCYQIYRQSKGSSQMSRNILHAMLKLCCSHHSSVGIRQVMDDWARCYGHPPDTAFRAAMSAFASQGDSKAVRSLWHQFLGMKRLANRRHPTRALISRASEIAPLLHVHAKRGELSEVVRLFDNLIADYNIKPNITLWNILLNAYGKARDLDGAFFRFDQMLQTGVKADSYTFGTLIGMSVEHGDLDQAVELYQLAESLGVPRTIAMVDGIVIGHIQQNNLIQAERICQDALSMSLDGPVTHMWNCLLTAYAMQRDMDNVNRVLRMMTEKSVKYNAYTYAALMQALAMVSQPEAAYDILRNVLPESSIKATPFHYAIVMRGFLAVGSFQRVVQVHQKMTNAGLEESFSTRMLRLKAAIALDREKLKGTEDTKHVRLAEADKLFQEAIEKSDAQEIVDPYQKGAGHDALGVNFSTSGVDHLIFIYGQYGAFERVKQLYDQYLERLPETQAHQQPVRLLSALMVASLKQGHYDEVQKYWDLAFDRAKKQGQPIKGPELQRRAKVLPAHRLALAMPLSTQMTVLARKKDYTALVRLVKDVEMAGFKLNHRNWNLYVQLLTLGLQYREAFSLCETRLMPHWTGWARLRWRAPVRNRLPIELRRRRRDPLFIRPMYHTMLFLARALTVIEGSKDEADSAQELLAFLHENCPKTLRALKSMVRVDDDLERAVLGR